MWGTPTGLAARRARRGGLGSRTRRFCKAAGGGGGDCGREGRGDGAGATRNVRGGGAAFLRPGNPSPLVARALHVLRFSPERASLMWPIDSWGAGEAGGACRVGDAQSD